MKPIDLALFIAFCLTASTTVRADDSPLQTESSNSELSYYGTDQPFAHPSPPSLRSVPPGSYIPAAPQTFIPIAGPHMFADARLPTVADATVRVFIRSYDTKRGVYVNEEVLSPTCLLACLSRQEPAL